MRDNLPQLRQTPDGGWEKLVNHIYVPLEDGDMITHKLTTAKQRAAWQEYQKHRRSNEPFTFAVSHGRQFGEGLKYENICRLAMLATYSSWDVSETGDNILKIGETRRQRNMTQADMQEILGLKRNTFNRFLNETFEKPVLDYSGYPTGEFVGYIAMDKEGRYMINRAAFFKGDNAKKVSAYRLYSDNIRKLYNATEQRNHKDLGKIFALLPFLNYEWNILCYNPDEKDRDKIKPLTLTEIYKLLGMKGHDSKKLMKQLIDTLVSIKVDIDGIEQTFCAVSFEKTDTATKTLYEIIQNRKIKTWLTINPFLIYSGNHREEVVQGAEYFIHPDDRHKYPALCKEFTTPQLQERPKNANL